VFDFLRDAITLDLAANPGYSAPRVRNFALKLQQFTGPLTAKALEDTAFYRYHRLIALNEVGGDPAEPALDLEKFHRRQRQHADEFPGGLTATATHDTKRGEDARARILALSELAQDWDNAVRGWRAQNALLVQQADTERRPSLGHEYMLYQALIGAWPGTVDRSFVERMCTYAVKAAREGKEETSWTNPNESYEAGLQQFLRDLLDEGTSAAFLASFAEFADRTALMGALNGLSQLALKGLLPGVPDFYQGTELWDFSLVDPDNRRPVDFAAREQELAAETAGWADLAANWRDGRIKLALTRVLLRLRQEFAEVFRSGTYEPLPVTGRHAGHVIAFTRNHKRQRLIVAVGRHFAPLTDGGRHWPDAFEAAIPLGTMANYADVIGTYSNFRTNELNLAHHFRHLPVSVLRRV
jgi:(1->4)-alpha-D-glucan 1-alpha-D-glucosylmutase